MVNSSDDCKLALFKSVTAIRCTSLSGAQKLNSRAWKSFLFNVIIPRMPTPAQPHSGWEEERKVLLNQRIEPRHSKEQETATI